ncbi:4-alpha-glucanotransferase, partial [Dietzia alimentaria]|uniref:4-alpha-glucanotransferase n=1 Tax=Dietzia alimentaria TaxID=665550 RepID=UPI00029A2CAB
MTADTAFPSALAELADACGVATSYVDAHGAHHDVSERTLRAVLAAMGVVTDQHKQSHDDDDDDRAVSDHRALEEFRLRSWRRVLPATVVAEEAVAAEFSVHVPRGATVSVWAHLEESDTPLPLHPRTSRSPREQCAEIDGVLVDRISFGLPKSLPIGWHRIVSIVDQVSEQGPTTSASNGGQHPAPQQIESTLVVYPSRIPLPADLDERRAVGLATQLYQIRSEQSWGMGDLADLAELVDWAGRDLAADFVLVNPMHAAEPFPPVSPSPYLPTSRLFAAPLYLRPERIPEYGALSSTEKARVDELAASASAMNSADSIDRDASWAGKLEALRIMFDSPMSPRRAEQFDRFLTTHGENLSTFAIWCSIAGVHGSDTSQWPAALSNPESDAVADHARAYSNEVLFHQWLQWTVAQQRADAQASARDAGMRLGIIHDLAVGVHPTGADAWVFNTSLARGVSVGAPPDIYNQRGQDWSQPPLRPDALAEGGYRQFRDIVRAALRDAGGIRIDHILGLFRLWWIPSGSLPTEGTYVHYDHEAMLGVLALEATRAGAVVIGEDLGTVAPGVREELAARGILGTSVMWFEQDASGPIDPQEYRRL